MEELQSNILSDEEIGNLLDEGEVQATPEVVLPSDSPEVTPPTTEELQARIKELEAQATNQNTPTPSTDLVEEYVSKYQEQGGELSEADYTELAKKGYSKDFVNTYIEGMNAKVNAEQQAKVKTLAEPYGGEAKVQEAIAWAKETWNEADKTAFNTNISTGSDDVQKLLVASLMREFTQSKQVGTNKPIHTNNSPQTVAKGYNSKSEMIKDMGNPKYKTDMAFNTAVQKKLMLTDQSKWYRGTSL